MATETAQAPMDPRDYAVAVEQAKIAVFKELFKRDPLPQQELLVQIHDSGWPLDVYVHPADFFYFTAGNQNTVHKDNNGPYFYVSSSRIRPVITHAKMLDLSEWQPSKIQLANFSR